MNNIADLFYETAEKYPEKLAICCDNNEVTYRSLSDMVSQCSNFFIDIGIEYGDHIGVPMNNSIESVILILTAANLGLALVPINPTLSLNDVNIAFELSDVKYIVARSAFLNKYIRNENKNFYNKIISMDSEFDGAISLKDMNKYSKDRPICKKISGNENFIITMTSGSTGNPKPIILTQENKLKRIYAHIKLYNIMKNDNILAATPLYHSLAERLILIPLLIGGTSILMSRFTPEMWVECIKIKNVTFTIAVSAQLNQITRLFSDTVLKKLKSLRCLVSSSSLLEEQIKIKLIENLKCDFYEMYGTSETSTVTSINFKETLNKKNSIGKTLPEAVIKIINEKNEICLPGEIGEICCKTELLCNGYYGMNEVFNMSLDDGFFKTGDMGYIDEDNYLFFSGRKKEIIITGGINVYPQDVEQCISKIEEINECVAFSYPDEKLGEVVAVAVVSSKDINKRAIQVQCAKNLADYQQPHKIFFIDSIPKNSMNKVMRNKILEHITLK